MKNIILLFLFLIPAFLFAQYPSTGNKARLGYQTTGDGLIWRGVAADTVNKPNNRNYPYFQLDTVNAVLYRYIQTRGKWQAVSPDLSSYLEISDTTAMLAPYITRGDTSSMLTRYIERGDTAAMLLNYPSTAGYGIIDGGKTWRVDTTSPSGLATRLFSRGLSTTIGDRQITHSNGSNLIGNTNFLFTTTSNLLLGTTTDVPTSILTARSTTKSSSPFPLHTLAQSDAITGAQGNFDYETTQNGLRWYNGTRKAYALESTFARGTATRVPVFDANGQIVDYSGLIYNSSGNTLTTGNNSTTEARILIKNENGTSASNAQLKLQASSTAARYGELGKFSSGASTYKVIKANDTYLFNSNSGGDLVLLNDNTSGKNYFQSFTGNIISAYVTDQVLTITSGNGTGTSMVFENTSGAGYSYTMGVGGATSFSPGSWGIYNTQGNITTFGTSGVGKNVTLNSAVQLGFATGGLFNVVNPDVGFARNSAGTIWLVNGAATHATSTGGLGIGYGTTAQTPTEFNGLIRMNSDTGTVQIYTNTVRQYLATRAYARGVSFYGANGSLTSNRTVTGGSFWLNLNSDVGVKQSAPTQELDVNGDLYVRDSIRLGTTPAPSSISGIAILDANNWVGKASLGTGLSYTAGVLSATGGGNSIYNNLPVSNVSVNAGGNSLDISAIGELTLGGSLWEIYADDFETDIYNPEYVEILAGTGAGAIFDNATETTTLKGEVKALRESYNAITSTTSPVTLSSTIPDNLVNQGGTQATFTFLFPATPLDGQVLTLTYNNAISTLTLDGNGETIVGTAVTTAVEGSQRKFKFYTGIGWIKLY